jgi:DNA-binding transcriptional ArsR family regulator
MSAYEPRFARVAAMIADPARSRMLAYLLGGHAASAGELAEAAGVGASTASGHLAQLVDSGLVMCEPRGRHRYFRLTDAEVAHALEALALVAERSTHDSAWASPERRRLREARRCYSHLAGRIGVALHDTLVANDALRPAADGYALTDNGRQWLAALALQPPTVPAGARLAYACLDWSERRDHLAGPLATLLLEHFQQRHWLVFADRTTGARAAARALIITPAGRRELLPLLGLRDIG